MRDKNVDEEALISDIINDLYGLGYETDMLAHVFNIPEKDIKKTVGDY